MAKSEFEKHEPHKPVEHVKPTEPAVPPKSPDTVVVDAPKRFRLRTPDGQESEYECDTVQDAIRKLNGNGTGKVYTRKQLTVTEL